MVRVCKRCALPKEAENFYCNSKGYHSWCKGCCSIRSAERYQEDPIAFKLRQLKSRSDPRKRLLEAAQARAALKGRELDITLEDIQVPDKCPIFGVPLQINLGKAKANSPSLDRIDPTKGYIKGNVQVISNKANSMKSNATKEELLLFADWIYKSYGK